MLKKEIAQVEHWFHTEAERFMLRHQGLGILLIFGCAAGSPDSGSAWRRCACPAGGMAVRRTVTGPYGDTHKAAGCILSQSGYNSG